MHSFLFSQHNIFNIHTVLNKAASFPNNISCMKSMIISKIFKIQRMFTYLFYISLIILKHWGPYKIQIDADHSAFPKFSRTVIHNCAIFPLLMQRDVYRILPSHAMIVLMLLLRIQCIDVSNCAAHTQLWPEIYAV